MEPPRPRSIVRFGIYEISFQSGELRKGRVKIKVQQQPLKLLELLLEHPGEIITREDLRSRIWPQESFGDFDQTVNVAIAKLRGALGDSAENPRYIETLPAAWVSLIAEVAIVDTVRPVTQVNEKPPVDKRLGLPLGWKITGLTLVVVLVVLTTWILYPRRGPSPEIRSLAVLPLESLSVDASTRLFRGWHDR